jgi:hypothetical protein
MATRIFKHNSRRPGFEVKCFQAPYRSPWPVGISAVPLGDFPESLGA